MAEKNNLKYIKTAPDLNHLYDFEKENVFRDENHVFPMDFDINIFFLARYNPSNDKDARFYRKLVDNTLKTLNKKQKDEFANRLADALMYYWNQVYGFGGAEKWNGEDLQRRAEYTPYHIIINHAAFRGLFGEEGSFKFKKSISPDNQVLLDKSGFTGLNYDYNFSNLRLEDVRIITPFIPKQSHGLYGNDKALFDKFEKDFGRTFDPKTAFKNAENPYVLFELRSGKIHPTSAMPKLNSSDFKYIIPKQDFKDLDSGQIYDMLSLRNVRWEQWQVAAMMEMIVDKVPDVDNGEYLNQIMEIVSANRPLFLKDTNDNHKLWLKIEDKFRAHIDRSKEYIETLKRKIEKLRSDIKANESDIDDLKRKLNVLNEESNSFVGLERRISSISDFRTDYYYYNHQVKVIQDALYNASSGKYEKVSVPEKPWKVFGWEKEKKQYEELLSVIEQLNNHIDLYKEKRDETFGEHDFNLTAKINQLYAKIGQKNEQNRDNLYVLRDDEPMVRVKRPHDIVQENVDKQKDAKKVRMENYQKKLKEKGVVLGQKSGVVEADKKAKKIIFDKAIEKMMKKLRATPANANKSDKELMEIAKKLVAENQK